MFLTVKVSRKKGNINMSPVCTDNSEKAEAFGFGSTKKPTFHTFHLTSVCEMLALHHYTENGIGFH